MFSISIVVPSYNQGKYLDETLNSIINQGYPSLELFVVDGGSTDNSVDIIKKHEEHITWWVSEKDKGQSDAINKGLQRATGDIITWLNSDDVLQPGALAAVAKHFSENPSAGLVHGGIIIFNEAGEIKKDWGYTDHSVERYLAGMSFSQPASFFKRTIFQKIGGRVSEELHFGMDYDLFSRMALVSTFIPVKEVLAKYRLHDESKSVAEQHQFIRDWSRVFINICKNLSWKETISELGSATNVTEEMNYFRQFQFIPETNIAGSVDKRRMLFYQLCYHVKAAYLANRFDDARKTLKWINTNYPHDWMAKEKSIPPIMRNLKFPDFIIRLMQKMKTAV